jgi:hypothetical protein
MKPQVLTTTTSASRRSVTLGTMRHEIGSTARVTVFLSHPG